MGGAAAAAGCAGSSLTASFGADVASVSAGLAAVGSAVAAVASGLFSPATAVLSEEGVPAVAGSVEGVDAGAGTSAFAGSDEEDDGAGSGAGVAAGVLVVGVVVVCAGGSAAGGGASWARAGRAAPSTIEAVAKKATPNRLTPINRFPLAANGVSSR